MDKLAKGQPGKGAYKVAVASSDGIVVNQHFGRANAFYIYQIGGEAEYSLLEVRKVVPVCNGGDHDDDALHKNIRRLADCKYVLVSRIGMGAANMMEQSGMVPMELPGMIEESIDRLIAYEKIQNLF